MMEDKLEALVNTISNRLKTDVQLDLKLKTSIGDIRSGDISLPALNTVLCTVEHHTTELIRRIVFTEVKRYLRDYPNIILELEGNGFSADTLEQELELLKYILEPTEFQPKDSDLIPRDESPVNLKLTDNGFEDADPVPDVTELPIVTFRPGTTLTFTDEGEVKEIKED